MVNRSVPEFAQNFFIKKVNTAFDPGLTSTHCATFCSHRSAAFQGIHGVEGQRPPGQSRTWPIWTASCGLEARDAMWGSGSDSLTEYRRDPADHHLLLNPSFYIQYLLSAWSPEAVCEQYHHKGTAAPCGDGPKPNTAAWCLCVLSFSAGLFAGHGLSWFHVCLFLLCSFMVAMSSYLFPPTAELSCGHPN